MRVVLIVVDIHIMRGMLLKKSLSKNVKGKT